MEKFIAGISLETKRVSCVIGVLRENSETSEKSVRILSAASREVDVKLMNRGCPNNMNLITQLVYKVVEEAENSISSKKKKDDTPLYDSPVKASDFYLSVHGSDFICLNGRIEKNYDTARVIKKEILNEIFEDSLDELKTKYPAISGSAIIHTIPGKFTSKNSHVATDNPLDMALSSLICDYIAVATSAEGIDNINTAATGSGDINIQRIFYTPVAVGEYLLSTMEKTRGVILLDMGRLSTTMSIYKDGSLLFFREIDTGGENVTINIQEYLNQFQKTGNEFSFQQAEKLKKERAAVNPCFLPNNGKNTTPTDAQDVSDEELIQKCVLIHLSEVLSVLENYFKEFIQKNHIPQSAFSSIVLTGGGSEIKGMQNLIKEYFSVELVRPGQTAPASSFGQAVKIECPVELQKMDYLAATATLHYAMNAPSQNDLCTWNMTDEESGSLLGRVVNIYEKITSFFTGSGKKDNKNK